MPIQTRQQLDNTIRKMQLPLLPRAENAPVLGQIGNLITRLAQTPEEIEAAQSLRFDIFSTELGALLPTQAMCARRDFDAYDPHCDHLLVFDTTLSNEPIEQIVGTYRLMRQDVAENGIGFYSQSEFDINTLVKRKPNLRFMELGRSCVLPKYRTKRTIELLWQGTWAYALTYKIDVMFGCASFSGKVAAAHAASLSFLHHNYRAGTFWDVKAHEGLHYEMDLVPSEAINNRRVFNNLPPLIKGYLRIGAKIGNGAVVDAAFGTTDVIVILPISAINERYMNHYGADAGRFKAHQPQ